ncbi:DNA (cytosine-5-)-methyltransferase [Bacillus mycoides]|uniref:DNA (cytosine-5-)-methyltransferase n=1 Tax=Bacillus mycoides TaxID=1405 RepID=UPI0011F0455F|nr:DNA (cytosine-5-)-methyltransferase [Bacillus mycoides]QEL88514.1 DNA (cytosine-5-)-methyltransferase [Bacillus mycoides]
MKFLDLFAGIGGFRLGMEAASHECVGYVEIDKFARKSYEAIHNTEGEWTAHDITTVTNDDLRSLRGKVDIICGGFPCQAFSIAGKRLGFAETRGTLFFEIARFAKEIQPQYLFLENVKGLLNHEGGNTFRTILSTLDELGYDAEWQICNSKDYGVPQNRERVFIIGHLRGRSRREVFPIGSSYGEIGNVQRQQVYANTLRARYNNGGTGAYIVERKQHEEGIGPQVLVKEATKLGYAIAEMGDSINFSVPNSKTRRGRVGKGIAQTLDTACNQAIIENKPPYRIRRLTPKECWRLQGFPDWAFDRAREVNSDSQLYKQAGNSVTVNVINAIAERLV